MRDFFLPYSSLHLLMLKSREIEEERERDTSELSFHRIPSFSQQCQSLKSELLPPGAVTVVTLLSHELAAPA